MAYGVMFMPNPTNSAILKVWLSVTATNNLLINEKVTHLLS